LRLPVIKLPAVCAAEVENGWRDITERRRYH
jgi:hypothetical protein